MAFLNYTKLQKYTTNIKALMAKLYVAKEASKGLSTNDYSTAEKNKLAGIAENANNYSLPTAAAGTLGGVKIGANVSINEGAISVADGSTTEKGIVQLSEATNSASNNVAATASAVKAAYDLANGKQSPQTTIAGYGITDAYTKAEVDAKLSSAYKAAGSIAPNGLTASLLSASYEGKVYNVSGEFTTSASFVEGAGNTHPAGTNVVVVDTSEEGETPVYKFDVLAGFVDLSGYALEEDTISDAEIDALFPELAS